MYTERAAVELDVSASTVKKYIRIYRLKTEKVFDPVKRCWRIDIDDRAIRSLKESDYKNRKSGRPKGSKDVTTNRSLRINAAQKNGRLGGLAGRGKPKNRRT